MNLANRVLSLATLLCLTAPAVLFGQLKTPAASPLATVKQTVGLTDVEIVYSRPGVKGREIFGSLVPYEKVWRTGANQPTKITFSDDVILGGSEIPAGTYALYAIPGESEWTVIVYTDTKLWGAFGYDEAKDLARISATPSKLSHLVESFTIGVDAMRNDEAVLYLDWEYTRVALPLEVPTRSKVLTQIDELKSTPEFEKPNVLFAAGTYYHESGIELETALAWVSKACEDREKPAYWMFARKARIELDLGKKDAARASAEKTLELAVAGGNPDYQKIAKDILAAL